MFVHPAAQLADKASFKEKTQHGNSLHPDPFGAGIDGMNARRYIVRGRVQGVGFRWFVDFEARQLGLAGWVRNTTDGTVEVLAMGTEQQLAALQEKLRKGPRAARVDAVQESLAEPVPGLKTFGIEGAW